jgi:hypothetical protein
LLDTNVFSYYKYLAETGDIQAVLGLAQLYLTGGKGVPMDLVGFHSSMAKCIFFKYDSSGISGEILSNCRGSRECPGL